MSCHTFYLGTYQAPRGVFFSRRPSKDPKSVKVKQITVYDVCMSFCLALDPEPGSLIKLLFRTFSSPI
jgi:hypothetical protein